MSQPVLCEDRKSRSELQAEQFQAEVELIAALGRALHSTGLPSHRLEATLSQVALRLGTPVQVFAMPTGLLVTVGAETHPTTMLLRVEPSRAYLERLTRLMAVARAVVRGQLDAPEAKRRIDFVMRAPPRWGRISTALSFVLSAGAFAVVFGGGLLELATSLGIGLVSGLLAIAMPRLRASTRMFELLAAAAAAVIANLVDRFDPNLVEWIPLASGLIILLPGLALVDALEELAHGHLASGGARLAGVGVVLLVMGFGAVLGTAVVFPRGDVPTGGPLEAQPMWWLLPALVAVSYGSMVGFRARPRDYWAVLAGSTIAVTAARLGAYQLGTFAGAFVAALALGGAANLFAYAFRQPPQLLTVPGLALLVPGSVGVRSMSLLMSHDVTVGVDTAFDMFLIAMALVSGLLVSSSLFRENWQR